MQTIIKIISILMFFMFLSSCELNKDKNIFEITTKEKNNENISIEIKNISKEEALYEI